MVRTPKNRSASSRLALLPLLVAALVCAACVGDDGAKLARDSVAWSELTERFKSEAVLWARSERERFRPLAAPLPEPDRLALAAYFSPGLLDRARVLVVEGFDNPPFFAIFEEQDAAYPVDLRRASGLALVDTILIASKASTGARRDQLLFHELVHLVQYEVLGLERYMEGYVNGWAENGRDYRAIPHERQAYELARRYDNQSEPFSVEDEVRSLFSVFTPAAAL